MSLGNKQSRTGKLFILTGPSCGGKTPLVRALRNEYPSVYQALESVVCYTSRAPRPGERDGEDYYFRSREDVASLQKETDFIVTPVRNDLQAIDTKEILNKLKTSDILYEGNPYIALRLWQMGNLTDIEKTGVFLSPLSKEELLSLRDNPNISALSVVRDLMRRKLLRRTQRHKGILSLPDLTDIEERAKLAYHELSLAHRFDAVITCHDGEDSDNWSAFPMVLGEARRAMETVAAVVTGAPTEALEHWDHTIVPQQNEV